MADLAYTVAQSQPSDNRMRVGTVRAFTATSVDVLVSGTLLPNVGKLGSYSPAIGDRVAVQRQDGTWLCLGTLGPSVATELLPPDFKIAIHQATGAGTATAAFATIPGTGTSNYTKKASTATKLDLRMELSWFAAGGQASLAIGLAITGPVGFANGNYEVVREVTTNAANGNFDFIVGGAAVASGGPTGVYGFTPIWFEPGAGAGTPTLTVDSRLSFYVEEILV